MKDILLIPLKIIAAIVLVPFHLIGSVASHLFFRKQAVIWLRIIYVSGKAFITSECNSGEQESAHFIVAYLLFLSQYFFSCDKRQVAPVAKCLADHIANRGPPGQLATVLLQTINTTLNPQEKDAVEGLLLKYPNRPPLTYIEGTPIGSKIAKYTFITYKKGDRWLPGLHMSFWLNNILFPITVGVLYNYVADKLIADDKNLLDSCITRFLAALESSDYRSTREGAWALVANRIITENLGV
jgi:hypothetical protein